MKDSCNCCEGIEALTPILVANRPGLEALEYRMGSHASFLETMKARLSSFFLDIPQEGVDEDGRPKVERVYPLRALTTRAPDDASIAFLDAWATVGDVLTFYQERIANEGYLRSATERRSILELARLVGYALRPGVASTVYLVYTIDDNFKDEVIIPAGARSQSVPGPDELPQSFETSEPLPARAAWNILRPRISRPQTEKSISNDGYPRVYLKGTSTNLKPNDPLLIDFGTGTPQFVRVKDVQPDTEADRTLVRLQDWHPKPPAQTPASPEEIAVETKVLLNNIIVSHLEVEVERRDLSRSTKMFRTVSGYLESLRQHLAEDVPFPAMIAHLNNETLPGLARERETAEGNPQYSKLWPWLESVMTELNDVVARSSNRRAEALAREFTFPAFANVGKAILQGDQFTPIVTGLTKPASVPPANAFHLMRNVDMAFRATADTTIQIMGTFEKSSRESLPIALANTKTTPDIQIKVYALRVKAGLFGNKAQKRMKILPNNDGEVKPIGEWPIVEEVPVNNGTKTIKHEEEKIVYLDASYDKILPDNWIVVDTNAIDMATLGNARVKPSESSELVSKISQIQADTSRGEYGMVGPTTRVVLGDSWLTFPPFHSGGGEEEEQLLRDAEFQIIRRTVVYAQSEELPLAEEPIDDPINDPICNPDDATDPNDYIELDGLYTDLQAGRWLIVSGERADIKAPDPDNPDATVPVTGVKSGELAMLAEVVQSVSVGDQATQVSDYYSYGREPLRGEKIHTFIRLANQLEYCFKRDTVTIYGNVVKATHGETRNEVLGSGDSSQVLQSFTLKQPPLTFVPASNPRGVENTLHVRVNDIEWHEAETLADQGPTDRKFITRTSDDSKTTVIFGNGQRGARLPTGQENVKAAYRNGIGKAGNVKAEQISLLATRPLGVQEVINPLRASGGADKENRDQARKNAPLAVLALDRLVSTQDYADFARTFAGIGKASAARLSDGRRQLAHITIAGADDIPIDKSSDLYRNLTKALREFGDHYQPLQVEMRELMLIVISANVRILPDYLWESVVPKIRTKLLDTFSFERRELGQDVLLSEVVSAIQAIEGVTYVDVDTLRGIPEKTVDENYPGTRRLLTPDEIAAKITGPLTDAQGNIITDSQGKPLKEPLSRVIVNLAATEGNTIRPAQLAFLSPEVEAALILNEVKL
ncbi:MAG: putative baseplate assembly protein [Anaerolineales bacterium]|jgi:hypothetical protein